MEYQKKIKCELYRDSMQNYKKYAIRPAQLIIADVPYNVGNNFYGSNPMWYNGGDNKNGESKLAGKAAFNSDFNFNLYEYFHFCSKMLSSYTLFFNSAFASAFTLDYNFISKSFFTYPTIYNNISSYKS